MIYVAIKSCQKDVKDGSNQAIRDTWLKRLPSGSTRYRFYVGGVPRVRLEDDEVYLKCGDNFDDLPDKTFLILKDFMETYAEFLFLCDTDTYVVPNKLFRLPYELYDYSGVFSPIREIGKIYINDFADNRGVRFGTFYNYASTHGCFFSRKAVLAVLSRMGDAKPSSVHWADDLIIGQLLGPLVASEYIWAANLPNYEGSAIFHMNASEKVGNRQSPAIWMRNMHAIHGEDFL